MSAVTWTQGVHAGDTVSVNDGELTYGARIPESWTEAEIIVEFARGYDTSIGRDEGGCWEGMTEDEARDALIDSLKVTRLSPTTS